jgi:methyl-accepting chemotaxis protein
VSFLISSVRRQLIGAFVAVSLVFMIALVIGWSGIGSVNSKVQSGAEVLPVLEKATGHARDMVASEVVSVLDPANIQNHLGDVQTFQQTVGSLGAYATTPAAKAAEATLSAEFAKWRGLDSQVLALAKAHKVAAATKLAEGAANTEADALTTAVENASKAISDANTSAAGSTASSSKTLMLVIALLALLAAGAISFVLARDLSRRIQQLLGGIHSLDSNCITDLEKGLGAIADGDLTVEVTPVTEPIATNRADEIGELTRTFNGMVEKIQHSVSAYNTTRAKVASMLRDISNSAEQLTLSSQQMANTSEEAGRAVGEIAQAVGSVAAGAEDQVRSIAEAKLLTDAVAMASHESADGAQQTAEAAAHARDLAERGAEAVSQATDAMQAVRDSSAEASSAIRSLDAKSEQIGDIVGTITGIAEQTNLLALNAAIAAAVQDVGSRVEQIAGSIQEIASAGSRVQDSMTSVAAVAEESSASSEQVSASTQQTSASTEEIAASATELARTAEELERLVSQFTLA